jgi:phage tail-like protein
MPSQQVDPYRAYHFKLEIQGVTSGHFTECSEMGARMHKIPYREAGSAQQVRMLPGPVEYADVTLRYGLTTSRDIWDWFMNGVHGDVQRRNVSIVMLGEDGVREVLRWNLVNTWASAWRGALLDALGREAAIESVTLTFESLERG